MISLIIFSNSLSLLHCQEKQGEIYPFLCRTRSTLLYFLESTIYFSFCPALKLEADKQFNQKSRYFEDEFFFFGFVYVFVLIRHCIFVSHPYFVQSFSIPAEIFGVYQGFFIFLGPKLHENTLRLAVIILTSLFLLCSPRQLFGNKKMPLWKTWLRLSDSFLCFSAFSQILFYKPGSFEFRNFDFCLTIPLRLWKALLTLSLRSSFLHDFLGFLPVS